MFGLLGDMAEGLGKIVGTTIGSIAGLSSAAIGTVLGITSTMVDEAKEAGCETYEEIRDFFDL